MMQNVIEEVANYADEILDFRFAVEVEVSENLSRPGKRSAWVTTRATLNAQIGP